MVLVSLGCLDGVEREVGQLLRAMRSNACRLAAAVRSSAASAAAAAPTRPVLVLAQSLGCWASGAGGRLRPIVVAGRPRRRDPGGFANQKNCPLLLKPLKNSVASNRRSRQTSTRPRPGRSCSAQRVPSAGATPCAGVFLPPRAAARVFTLLRHAGEKHLTAPQKPARRSVRPLRVRHAPQYPARRRYAPRARPQKCSRRTGETVTTKTTYAGSHRARTPQRSRPHDCVTAATAGEHLGNHHDPASYKRAPFVPP